MKQVKRVSFLNYEYKIILVLRDGDLVPNQRKGNIYYKTIAFCT